MKRTFLFASHQQTVHRIHLRSLLHPELCQNFKTNVTTVYRINTFHRNACTVGAERQTLHNFVSTTDWAERKEEGQREYKDRKTRIRGETQICTSKEK